MEEWDDTWKLGLAGHGQRTSLTALLMLLLFFMKTATKFISLEIITDKIHDILVPSITHNYFFLNV